MTQDNNQFDDSQKNIKNKKNNPEFSINHDITKDIIDAKKIDKDMKNLSDTKKGNKIFSKIIISIIIPIILSIGLLVFAYQNNLIGLKDYVLSLFEHSLVETNSNLIKKHISESQTKEGVNATQAVLEEKNNNLDTDTPFAPKLEEQKEITIESSIKNAEIIENPNNDIAVNSNNKENFKEISQTLIALIYKLNSGEPYLENLIDLKSKLKDSKILISTLTEYASGGFPTDVIIISDMLEILNKLVILQARNESDNFFEKIINKFIIITPTSKINGFSGILFDIKKALNDGDFETVLKNIEQLKPQQKKAFDAFVLMLKDKKIIQTEIQLLNGALINDTAF